MPKRKWGSEKLVNAAASGSQSHSDVAVLVGGGFVTVWEDESAGPDGTIRAQRYDAAGSRLGGMCSRFVKLLLIFGVVLSSSLVSSLCQAQQGPQVPRIGFISSSTTSLSSPFLEGLRKGLKNLRYEEGRNIQI